MGDDTLMNILNGDYQLILVSGPYFDCPTCNDSTSFIPTTFWDEKELLNHILENVSKDRMGSIYVIDSDNGDIVKYSDIITEASNHRVTKLKFSLPIKHNVIIHSKFGKWEIADDAYLLLYEKDLK